MTAEDYAKQNGYTLAQVIEKIQAGSIPGKVDGGIWYVDTAQAFTPSTPPYRLGLGESLLEFVSFIILIAALIAGVYIAINASVVAGFTFMFQGLAAFALLQGFAGIIKLLKFMAEKMDQKPV